MAKLLHRLCPVCAKPFTCYASNPTSRCSVDCYHQQRTESAYHTRSCRSCGLDFRALIAGDRQYCGKACLRDETVRELPTKTESACAACGKRFLSWTSLARKYCSSDCYNRRRQEGKRSEALCLTCGKAFTFLKSWPHQYCSTRCAGKSRISNIKHFAPTRYTASCEQCTETFETTAKRTKGRFCSRRCKDRWFKANVRGENHPGWRGGGIDFYGTSWPAARRAARRRDKVCQDCGAQREKNGKNLSVHHLEPFRSFGVERHREANQLSNLVTLCRCCHMRREWKESGGLRTALQKQTSS